MYEYCIIECTVNHSYHPSIYAYSIELLIYD